MTADNSADIQAQADGALEIQKEVTVQPCDNDAADFDEASSSVTISADTDEAKATDDKPQEDAVAVLMSGCSASKPESVAAGLTAGTAVLSMHTVNDTKSLLTETVLRFTARSVERYRSLSFFPGSRELTPS